MSKWHRWRFLLVVFKVAFGLICVIFFIRWLLVNWHDIQSVWPGISWPQVLGSFLLLSISFLLLPSGMVIFVRGVQSELDYLQSARAYYGSQLAKYLPGGVWIYPTRLVIMKEMGFDLNISTLALGFENIGLVISSLFVGLVTLGAEVGNVWGIKFLVLLTLSCLSAAIGWIALPELLSWVAKGTFQLPHAVQRVRTVPTAVRIRLLLTSVSIYSMMWSLAGISFYLLITAIAESVNIESVPFIIGVFALAWFAGFISIFSPGGFGVREGVISVMLGALVLSPYPIMAALLFRLLWSLAEVMFLVFSLLVGKRFKQHSAATRGAT